MEDKWESDGLSQEIQMETRENLTQMPKVPRLFSLVMLVITPLRIPFGDSLNNTVQSMTSESQLTMTVTQEDLPIVSSVTQMRPRLQSKETESMLMEEHWELTLAPQEIVRAVAVVAVVVAVVVVVSAVVVAVAVVASAEIVVAVVASAVAVAEAEIEVAEAASEPEALNSEDQKWDSNSLITII
jgi:hypothetical protein